MTGGAPAASAEGEPIGSGFAARLAMSELDGAAPAVEGEPIGSGFAARQSMSEPVGAAPAVEGKPIGSGFAARLAMSEPDGAGPAAEGELIGSGFEARLPVSEPDGAAPAMEGEPIGSGFDARLSMSEPDLHSRDQQSPSMAVAPSPGTVAPSRGEPRDHGPSTQQAAQGQLSGTTIDSYLARFAEPDGYLDFARFGPVSSDVAFVLERAATTVRVRGWEALDEYDEALEHTKVAAAELLACAAHEVGMVSSTSHGLAAAAFALRGPGTVVVARTDFPAAVYPWLRAAERGGLAVRFAEGPLTVERLRPLLDESVRAVSVCAVDAGSGFVAPVADLKELIGERRVLVVDAVQALGATPFEVGAADVVAAGGQKFLRAGWGAAVLAVRERVAEFVGEGIGGWAGVDDPVGEAPHPHPSRAGGAAHMFTNPDGPAVAAFGAGLRLVLDTGVARIHGLIREAVAAIEEAARRAGAEVEAPGGGIMRLRMPGADPGAVHAALAHAGLTTTLRGAWIRVSPHATSRIELADRVGDVLRGLGGLGGTHAGSRVELADRVGDVPRGLGRLGGLGER